jgi:hypothetical protein
LALPPGPAPGRAGPAGLSPKCRHYWSAAIRGVPLMLEVFSTGIKLFAPSGALACSRLPGGSVRGSPLRGSPLRGSPLRGSPLRAARFRANLTQAAVAPAFLKPMVSALLRPEPSTRPVSGARPGGRANLRFTPRARLAPPERPCEAVATTPPSQGPAPPSPANLFNPSTSVIAHYLN